MWKLKAVSRIGSSYLTVKQTLQEIKCHQIYHFTSFHSQIIDVKKPFEILTWQYNLGLPLPTSRITLLFCSLVSQLFTPSNVHARPSNVWPCANCSLILRLIVRWVGGVGQTVGMPKGTKDEVNRLEGSLNTRNRALEGPWTSSLW